MKYFFITILAFFPTMVFASENGESDGGIIRFLPYAAAVIIYLISSKLKPKKINDKNILSMPKTTNKREIGPQDTQINYSGYEKKYKPIEPK